MKTTPAIIRLAILLALPATLPATETFQGTITYELGDEENSQVWQMKAKGPRVVIESKDRTGARKSVMDHATGQGFTILPGKKAYLETKVPRDAGNFEPLPPKGPIIRTGEQKEILGFPAEKLRYESQGQFYDIWVTPDLPFFHPRTGPMTPLLIRAMKTYFPDGALLLAIEGESPEGAYFLRAIAVEEEDIPDDAFSLPDGLRKISRPG